MNQSESKRQTQRLLLISGAVDLLLAGVKVIIGLSAHSHALVADGIHSLSDLATDIMVWGFNRVGSQEPDEDHPYGHARFETIGTLILSVLLLSVAVLIVWDSVERLMAIDSVQVPLWPALAAAAFSIAANEWLYQITRKLGLKIKSNLLIANAWHHRTDSLSSIIVLIGVAGAMLGLTWLEVVAAAAVGLMIARIAWQLASQSVAELVDTALSQDDVVQIKQIILQAEGVRGVHNLRTRRMGSDVFLDIHLQVDSAISVSEGHHIGEWVTQDLLRQFSDISDVIVHIDAEDDAVLEQHQQPENMAPLRREVREALYACWQDELQPDEIEKLTLHYLNNGVSIELYLNQNHQDPKDLARRLKAKASDLPWLTEIKLWQN